MGAKCSVLRGKTQRAVMDSCPVILAGLVFVMRNVFLGHVANYL